MTAAEMKAYKAKQLRYKKPIVTERGYDTVRIMGYDFCL